MSGLSEKSAHKRLLECLLCKKSFSIQSARDGEYFETGICRECYEEKEKDPTVCFGKTGEAGYSEEAIECQKFCVDRRVCKEFIQGQLDTGKSIRVPTARKNL